MEISEETKEGKIINKIVDVLESFCRCNSRIRRRTNRTYRLCRIYRRRFIRYRR
ncbi:hypothetical protein Q5M85_11455 [Paraclostridium bifermentans]|nr:hypothetical protein [Paraclostridium bifermentans]